MGVIPLDEALPIARQIAEALEAAHEQGIIHRDLKPANIKVRPDGTVKVLDFGLAKLTDAAKLADVGRVLPFGPAGSKEHDPAYSPHASMSPTITSPAIPGTMVGTILGTAAYMSPEQARGRPADKRADIWAFGCVLFEMLSGTPPFDGEDIAVVLASVIKGEPDWTTLSPGVPAALRRLLRRCLEKDVSRRLQAMGEARIAIADLMSGAREDAPIPAATPRSRTLSVVGAAVLVTAIAATAAMWFAMRAPDPVPPRVSRLQIETTADTELTIGGADRDLAITPDGSRVVYVGDSGRQLFVRPLDALAPVSLFTGAPRGLFTSPDGQWVGFIDGANVLKKVSMTGGPAITVATLDGGSRGLTWGPDNNIVFASLNTSTGVQRVAAAGGATEILTRPDRARGESDHLWPELLPGGRAVLFTVTALTGGLDAAQVAVMDLETKTRKVLVQGGSQASYVSGGYLVYGAGNSLRAIAFDPVTLETSGTAVPVVPAVVAIGNGGVDAAVAADGTLAYVVGDRGAGASAPSRTLVWVDRRGQETSIPAPPRVYTLPQISPDGGRVVLAGNDQDGDLWSWDFGRLTLTRLTFTPAGEIFPVWTPDGHRLIFSSEREGARNLFWQAADGTGAVERLTTSASQQNATAVSPDGARLLFTEISPKTGSDQMQVELTGSHRVTALVQSPFSERNGVISPDGRWLAYEANDSGQYDIYVRPYPDVSNGRWQVSTSGGTRPLWSRNSQELFFASSAGAIMRVGVERAQSWAATTPSVVVKAGYYVNPPILTGRMYDISPDGQRFLMIKEIGSADRSSTSPQIVVVQNWTEELKRLVPVR